MTEKYALLVGNGDYEDGDISNLNKPKRNIAAFERVLIDPDICGFAGENVKTLVDHPKTSVEKAIARFFADSERNDLRLLYFSGHGFLDSRGELFLAVQDTEKGLLSVSAVSASFIAREIANNRAKNQVVIFDCCYSGAFKKSSDGAAGSNVVVMTASDEREFAWEDEESLGDLEHSVFTHYLIQGLKTGEADGDADGFVSVTELYEYINEKMAASKQNPICLHPFSRQEGKIIIAKNPGSSPAQVPQKLLDGHYFVSYSPMDGERVALELYDALTRSEVPVWMDRKDAMDAGPSWETQVVRAIETCAGLLFVGTADSVRQDADCRAEWSRALKYKKPVIPTPFESGLELPHRLSGRRGINFSDGDLAANTSRLHEHLKWLTTSEGRLRMLTDRRGDAQHDLRRGGDDIQRERIRKEIAELDREIAAQQKIVDNPQAAQQRVRDSIERGLERERKPEKPEGRACAVEACTRFINPPPAMAPSYFQDRHVETRLAADFLKDPGRCLLTVSGRGGIGKTAMICRVLNALENGELPDDLGPFSIRGIVYLSAVGSRKLMLPHLFADLCKLLPSDAAEKLDALYRDPHAATERKMAALLSAFPPVRAGAKNGDADAGPVMLLMDNFEDVVDTETRRINDTELDDALGAILDHPPHGVKVIITTRVVPENLPMVRPERQMPLSLDEGLESPFAEQILREMDAGGAIGLKDAPDELLSAARERTRGYPRALEALFAILAADRDTRLEDILADAERLLPENVVEALVGEAFNRLDAAAQKVMQGLAIYGRPVTPTALDYLLEPWLPGVDAAPVLNRLVNMHFVRKEGGRYYLHPVDREYILARVKKGIFNDRKVKNGNISTFGLYHRGADYYKQIRLPKTQWKTLDSLRPQLNEFDLRYECEDFDESAKLLVQISYEHLLLFGEYKLIIKLSNKIINKINNLYYKTEILKSIGTAYSYIGELDTAITFIKKALDIAQETDNIKDESLCLRLLGTRYSQLGKTAQSIEYLKKSLSLSRQCNDIQTEITSLGNLGYRYLELAKIHESIEYFKETCSMANKYDIKRWILFSINGLGIADATLGRIALAIKKHKYALKNFNNINDKRSVGLTYNYLGNCSAKLGRTEEAEEYLQKTLSVFREIGNLWGIGYVCSNLAEVLIDQGRYHEAIITAKAGAEKSEKSKEAISPVNTTLSIAYIYQDNLHAAHNAIRNALRRRDLRYSHIASAIMGLINLKQKKIYDAKKKFNDSIFQADQILTQTPQYYTALDAKALALCGLVLCEDMKSETGTLHPYIEAAKTAYENARSINADTGVVNRVLRLFDTLSIIDNVGILADVRKAAEGNNA